MTLSRHSLDYARSHPLPMHVCADERFRERLDAADRDEPGKLDAILRDIAKAHPVSRGGFGYVSDASFYDDERGGPETIEDRAKWDQDNDGERWDGLS